MTKTTTFKTKSKISVRQLIERNQSELGQYFLKLEKSGLGKWEQRVVALLCRSNAYCDNNLPKLLELANDLKNAHEAQINFTEKYVGELFLPKGNKIENVEIEFLNEKIIPNLSQFLADNNS